MRQKAIRAPSDREGFRKRAIESFPLRRLSPCQAVHTFCELLGDELNFRTAHGLDVLDLRHYYRNLLLADGTPDPIGVHGYASRIAAALQVLRDSCDSVRLLDGGCGYGTESLLFAVSGADVTGVEFVPERVQLASSRIAYYERQVSQPLKARFLNADVVRYLETANPFDIIWVMEAISHIHPLENFLAMVYERLSTGGFLITSDPNALNPLAQYRAYRIRGTRHFKTRIKGRDPESGKPVVEAVERLFSVLEYRKKLKKIGFHITGVVTSGFLASSFIPSQLHGSNLTYTLLTSLQRMLQEIPVLRLLGTNFTIVAQKRPLVNGAQHKSTG